MYTMDEYLKVVTPYVHSDLVSPEALSEIRSLTQILPPFSTAGFECRLGANKSQVDFQVNLPCLTPSLSEKFLSHSAWQIFQEICHEWGEPKSFLHQIVRDIWLEFDIDEKHSKIPLPGIFLNLNNNLRDSQKLVEIAFKLLKHQVSPIIESNIRLCFDSLPAKARISHLGVMLSRSTQAIRINVRETLPEQLLDYLVQIGWADPANILKTLISDISQFVDCLFLSFDVGETVQPKIGLECFFLKQPKHEPRWQLFLGYLVGKGLCTPSKQNALFTWTGFCQKESHPELCPKNLTLGELLLCSRAFSIFTRNISHIKIVYQPGFFLEAKAYLEFSHNWFDASLITK